MNSPTITYTVSVRGKRRTQPILEFLSKHYEHIPREQIDSVFGFLEKTPFYGGRPYLGPQICGMDVSSLYNAGIRLRIPVTNHLFSYREYEQQRPFFDKYHREGNALIIRNDGLARAIKKDFPRYRLEASMIKNIKTQKRIDACLTLYDTIVLPMELNTKYELLETFEPKEKLTLFSTAGCAYNCPARTCYNNISRLNKFLCSPNPVSTYLLRPLIPFAIGCSRRKMKRALMGMVRFDRNRYIDMGYHRFKEIRSNPFRKSCH